MRDAGESGHVDLTVTCASQNLNLVPSACRSSFPSLPGAASLGPDRVCSKRQVLEEEGVVVREAPDEHVDEGSPFLTQSPARQCR